MTHVAGEGRCGTTGTSSLPGSQAEVEEMGEMEAQVKAKGCSLKNLLIKTWVAIINFWF